MRLRLALAMCIVLMFAASKGHANHIYGADFYYEHISGLEYRITLILYGNCEAAVFNTLNGATPAFEVYEGNNLVQESQSLWQQGAGEEVTPVCERELGSTKCKNASNPIPGVARYIYAALYTLPRRSANWRFHFTGSIPPTALAGRATPLGNIASGSIMALDARLNNLNTPNSSPRFTTLPTPFYCINVPQQYNQGAVDSDNDSLSYAVVPGLMSNGSLTPYLSPYSGTLPMNGDVTGWSFSPTTGQLDFTPNVVKQYLVVNEVKEYRAGVLVGTSVAPN